MQPPDPTIVDRVASLLATARSALFITGAGISADSGVPTYRGIGGLYDCDTTEDGLPIEVVLSGDMMGARPALSWKYIAQIERACRGAVHNEAHDVIARLERRVERVWVLTQNVDGFHASAGSRNIIDIHGDIHELQCTGCDHRRRVLDYAELDIPPRCACGAVLRPGVVLFGEMLPARQVGLMRRELARRFDVIVSVGTTSAFPYIAQPVIEGRLMGVPTVEINPGETEVSNFAEHRLCCGARAAFEAIWSALSSS